MQIWGIVYREMNLGRVWSFIRALVGRQISIRSLVKTSLSSKEIRDLYPKFLCLVARDELGQDQKPILIKRLLLLDGQLSQFLMTSG